MGGLEGSGKTKKINPLYFNKLLLVRLTTNIYTKTEALYKNLSSKYINSNTKDLI